MAKYFLSFHTIFIVNENIQWLEEFIIYYRYIGFEHFYLYNNEGSSGGVGYGTSTRSRRGYPINTTTTKKNELELNRILNTYKDYITLIKWQPRNLQGEIEYKQVEAVYHFFKNYGNHSEWVALMDLDEYIFSEKNIDLVQYLRSIGDVSCLQINQKMFKERRTITSDLISQDFGCLNATISWGFKNIVRCEHFNSLASIHHIVLKENCITITPDSKTLRFNHYVFNPGCIKQIKSVKEKLYLKYFPEINGSDNGMLRYKHIFDDYINVKKPLHEKKCINAFCKFFRNSNIDNNGGTHCCIACKKGKNAHGPYCERKSYS